MKWKRTIGRSAGIIVGLFIVALIAGYFVLKSRGFHEYVLAKIVQQGNEATGGKVEVRNFDFRISTLTAHLYGFTIHGTEANAQKPLLEVDKVTVGLKILSVLHHRVNLSELLIEHPVVHLIVDKNGRTNIPVPNAPKNKASHTNVFDLAVGHVLLTSGQVEYEDRKTPINADVRELRAEAHFNSLTTSYSGAISYRDGQIQYAGLAPLPHSLAVNFDATPSALNLRSLALTVGSSQASVQARVSDYNNPIVDATYKILLHTQDIAGLAPGSAPSGNVLVSGKLTYQSAPDHPVLRDVMLEGQVSSDGLGISSPQGHVELRKLGGSYQLADGNFHTRDFAVDLLNGRLTATLAIQHLDSNPAAKLHASLSGISLQAARASLNGSEAKTIPVIGTLRGTTDASWSGSAKNLRVRSDLDIRGAVTDSAKKGAPMIPVNGSAHVTYDGAHHILEVHQTTIRTPGSSISADGQISDHSSLTLHANTSDLHELEGLASIFQGRKTSANVRSSQLPDVSGSADLNALVNGSWQKPNISAQLNAQHLAVSGTEWRTLNLAAHVSPSDIS
ncbi:MAG: AsmA family protein, partial [Terriglobales bacterium]